MLFASITHVAIIYTYCLFKTSVSHILSGIHSFSHFWFLILVRYCSRYLRDCQAYMHSFSCREMYCSHSIVILFLIYGLLTKAVIVYVELVAVRCPTTRFYRARCLPRFLHWLAWPHCKLIALRGCDCEFSVGWS